MACWCEWTYFCWIFSMVWNVACPWREGFVGSKQPSQVQGWDRSLGMALQACHLTSCVMQCLVLQVLWSYYWGKLCQWCQNVKCMSVCRHELTKSLGVGHGGWGFKKRRKPKETDPCHVFEWGQLINKKSVVLTQNGRSLICLLIIMLVIFTFYVFLPKEDKYMCVYLVKGSLSFRNDELFDPASVPTNSRSVKPP